MIGVGSDLLPGLAFRPASLPLTAVQGAGPVRTPGQAAQIR
jgi:hypothetical protein